MEVFFSGTNHCCCAGVFALGVGVGRLFRGGPLSYSCFVRSKLCHQFGVVLLRIVFDSLRWRWPVTLAFFASSFFVVFVYFALVLVPMTAGTGFLLLSWVFTTGVCLLSLRCGRSGPGEGEVLSEPRDVAHCFSCHQRPWFPQLFVLLVVPPFILPFWKDLLRQPHVVCFSPILSIFRLHA